MGKKKTVIIQNEKTNHLIIKESILKSKNN